jgi:hypothetical protein
MRYVLVLLMAACGGGGDGEPAGCPDFATIADGTFARTGSDLTWTMDVVAIGELTFDRDVTPELVVEYRWGVDIDSNDDGTVDLRVATQHSKMSSTPATTTDIAGHTRTELLQVLPNGVSAAVGRATMTLAGNRFTFTTNDREDPALAMVTDTAQSTWITYHFTGPRFDDTCSDTFKP